MQYFHRFKEKQLLELIDKGRSILLLGPRQTGKTTLVKTVKHDKYINLVQTDLRLRYESDVAQLLYEIKNLASELNRKPLIIIDEIQKVPDVTDSIQILIDEGIAQFILTGSSARKIRNLLPGRVVRLELDPLSLFELEEQFLILEKLINNGSLPGIVNVDSQSEIDDLLVSYVRLYLEEEIRKEALVRNLGSFNNFLRLACIESGNIVSFTAISKEVGVSHSTISAYYQILMDCMLMIKVEPLMKTDTRKVLSKSPKFILFDLGIRRVGALESNNPTQSQKGFLFEQLIGLEIHRALQSARSLYRLKYWRCHSGPEVDFVLEGKGEYIPMEVKWTDKPNRKDIKHLLTFMNEYPCKPLGMVVCNTPNPLQLDERVIAINWRDLYSKLIAFGIFETD